jgi:L-fuconolactonase
MRNAPTRRELIGATAGAALLTAEHAGAEDRGVPIIDTHQHLWDFRLFHPEWLKGEPKLNKSTTMTDYRKATAGLNVRKAVYMEVDVPPKEQMKEAEWVEGVCASHKTPMAAAVVSCRPGQPGFEVYARRLHDMRYIRGTRQVLQVPETPPGTCVRSEYVRDIQLLGQLGMTFDICMRPTELADAVTLVDACPDVRFILDHCGNGSARNPNRKQWERDISQLARRATVVCKISGIIKTVPPGLDPAVELEPVVAHCIEQFGPDRVMFGGDWPVCNLTSSFAGWVTCLKAIVHKSSAADQSRLFHDNAARFYRLA